jgi:hypothetical protein
MYGQQPISNTKNGKYSLIDKWLDCLAVQLFVNSDTTDVRR